MIIPVTFIVQWNPKYVGQHVNLHKNREKIMKLTTTLTTHVPVRFPSNLMNKGIWQTKMVHQIVDHGSTTMHEQTICLMLDVCNAQIANGLEPKGHQVGG